MRSRVRAAIKPVDIIDEMFIADVVCLEWEVFRWRRLRASLMRTRGLSVLENFLSKHLGYDQCRKFVEEDLTEILQQEDLTEFLRKNPEYQTEDVTQVLAHEYVQLDPDAANMVLRSNGIDVNIWEILADARARKAKGLAQDYMRGKPSANKLIQKLLAEAGSSIDDLMVEALAKELDNIEQIDRLTTLAETRRNRMLREIDRRRVALGAALRRQLQEVEGEFEVIEKTPAEAKSVA